MCINGEVTAKDYYNCSGSVAHHNSDIWGASYPAGDPIGKPTLKPTLAGKRLCRGC